MGIKGMQARVGELATALSRKGLHPAVSMNEAEELVKESEDLYHRSPQDEEVQGLLLGSQIILHSACLSVEKPLWLRIAGLGVNEMGEPLLTKPASETLARLNGLALTNNAIARYAEGDELGETAHVVAAHALEFFQQPGDEGEEVSYIESRWTAAALVVMARTFDDVARKFDPTAQAEEYAQYMKCVQGYGQAAATMLEKCPAATPTLIEMARILAKPLKTEPLNGEVPEVEGSKKKPRWARLPKLNVKLPRRLPKFLPYDAFIFNSQ